MRRTVASLRQLQLLQLNFVSKQFSPSRLRLLKKANHRCYSTASTSEASKYEKKSPTEHVLLRPDTYIGGVGMRESHESWVFDKLSQRMVCKSLTYPPGLLKIFDEILVNAADNKCRDPSMTMLKVTVDRETSRISVWNNGKGLPIEVHPTEGMYVPTLIFGNLFTSSNYDDNEIKTVGGRNGYGAKLCNIFSKEFIVETVDGNRKKRFRQRWYDNMKNCEEAVVEEIVGLEANDYTKVEFVPDLARFHIKTLSDDIVDLIQRRVYDVAATLPRGVTVLLNDEEISTDGFEGYVKSFLQSPPNSEILFLHPTSRWHVGVSKRKYFEEDRNEEVVLPAAISFVNNINTEKGGTHIDYVMDKIAGVLKKEVDEKLGNKGGVKPMMIKSNISIFVNALIENPSFESQTKETLTTKPKFFGSVFEFDQKRVIDWANRTGLIDEIVDQILNTKKTKRAETSKRDSTNIRDIVKLEDASWAGITDKSKMCTLIVTEGDSAKALALAGLEILGREKFGVFPLKGKLANVSNLEEKKAAENVEVMNLMRILGLKFGENCGGEKLRYGKLMVLADQDEDGSHIKGLVINFIHRFWPELLQNGFVNSFRTPLLKARRGKEILSFFDYSDFRKWTESTEDSSKYSIKYYKGLGTSTSDEARQYFSNLQHHTVEFKYDGKEDDEAIRMAFDRDKSDERKQWIRKFEEEEEEGEVTGNEMSYKQFVDRDLMRFGVVDLRRSIPCLVDGLKPSQRKVLWTLLNMDESKEMKVSQLAGAVAHSQFYHHGEESLVRTIVRMGQGFCGAANLPLLQPIGQFGTRHEGGQDAASARYIFTSLAPTTRLIFPPADDYLLERRIEDGQIVEPKWLCPILPLILVNGSEGIGTGWSMKIANRNVFEVIDLTRRMIEQGNLNGAADHSINVQYEDFIGKIENVSPNRFCTSGSLEIIRPERKNSASFGIEISELPIGVWTSKYKEKLTGTILKDLNPIEFTEHHTEKRVKFRILLDRKLNSQFLKKTNSELLKLFRLNSTITENLVLFNSGGKLCEFGNVLEIAMEYFEIRKKLYKSRLEMIEKECEAKVGHVENQINFINAVTSGTIDLRNCNREELERKMAEIGISSDPAAKNKKSNDFDYLLEMPLSRLTPEETGRLEEKRERRRNELESAKNSDWKSTWMNELDKLTNVLRRKST